MYFQIAVNLMHVSICKYFAHFHMNITSSYVLMPFTFVYDLICVPLCIPFEVVEGILSLPLPAVLSICLPLIVWSFTFTEESDCEKINLALSEIIVITILLKL